MALEKIKALALGLGIGAGVGAVLSILLAPDSGENMRQKTQAYYEKVKLESAKIAERRRQELRAQLQAMTTPPEKPDSAQ